MDLFGYTCAHDVTRADLLNRDASIAPGSDVAITIDGFGTLSNGFE